MTPEQALAYMTPHEQTPDSACIGLTAGKVREALAALDDERKEGATMRAIAVMYSDEEDLITPEKLHVRMVFIGTDPDEPEWIIENVDVRTAYAVCKIINRGNGA